MVQETTDRMSKHLRGLGMAAAIAMTITASAQGKYGATPTDSVTCVQNLSLYQEFFNQKSYSDAYSPWGNVLRLCPASSKKMYVDGNTMLKSFIAKEKDAARKDRLIDSLYLVHDLRIANFGEKAFVLGRKGQDMATYSPDDCKATFAVLKEAVDLGGARSEDVTLSAYYQALNCMYMKGEATKDQMLSDYVMVMGHIETNLAKDLKEADRNYWVTARDNVNTLFFKVAECEDIGRIAQDMMKANPDDADMKARLLRILSGKDCTDEKVYLPLAEDVHRANPGPESAYSLAMYLVKRNDLSGASKFLKEAVELCNGCPDKSKYLLKAGQVASAQGSHGTARSYANQVLQIEPRNGEAMLLIGDAVSSQAGGCDVPDKWGVYWLAYDYYQKAKSIDPSVADKANDRLARTSAHFPAQGDAFFHQLTDNQSYQVACGGLNETTTVRTKK
jgi:tetratricopeptide (TPR) repeat protein